MDPLIKQAGTFCGLNETQMCSTLPKELTMWVDPKDVSYRFGENGSIGILFDEEIEQSETPESSQLTNQQTDNDAINKNFQSCKEQLMSVSKENNINQLKQLAAFVYS